MGDMFFLRCEYGFIVRFSRSDGVSGGAGGVAVGHGASGASWVEGAGCLVVRASDCKWVRELGVLGSAWLERPELGDWEGIGCWGWYGGHGDWRGGGREGGVSVVLGIGALQS
jgi:hypothetical protein